MFINSLSISEAFNLLFYYYVQQNFIDRFLFGTNKILLGHYCTKTKLTDMPDLQYLQSIPYLFMHHVVVLSSVYLKNELIYKINKVQLKYLDLRALFVLCKVLL